MASVGGKKIFWKVGTAIPDELSNCKNLFSRALLPRMLAWLTVDDESVTLLDGYNGGSYTPPSLYFSAMALPRDFLSRLRETKVCTLSLATTSDPPASFPKAMTSWDQTPTFHTFAELELEPVKNKAEYPSAIASSPVHMHCSLDNYVELGDDDDKEKEALVVLVVESFVISGSVLSPATETMKTRPNVAAKIDAELIEPVVGLGNGRICPLKNIHSLPRPVKSQHGGEAKWTSNEFNLADPTLGKGEFGTVEWNFREHGGTSPLGYNAVTALVMPRPIGWISTYHYPTTEHEDGGEKQKISHLAPYSFFSNVSRSMEKPMVAFSGYRKNNGETPKDAQNDAEQTGCFACNLVTEPLIVPMNLSAAELGREESEFTLSGLTSRNATLIDAPTVAESPIRLECTYFKSVPIGDFSIVVGKVVGIGIDESVTTDKDVDPGKLNLVTRLGFMDEYGTLDLFYITN